jgi:colanic acid/amylovoran biosynthesis glycosyltransferase
MKLAYITSMATGGLAGFNYRELVEFDRLGVDVSVFVTKHKRGPYMPPAKMAGDTVRPASVIAQQSLRFAQAPLLYAKLCSEAMRTGTIADFAIAQAWAPRMLRSGREWIHCHWGDHKLYIGYYCHRLTGLPLSVTLHGYDLYLNPNWAMFERGLRACEQIITVSDFNRQLLIRRFGALGERVKVIRLFAEMIPEPQALRRETKVLIVGGFHYRKGYDVLLNAIRMLNRRDIRLWVVGYKGPVDVQKLVDEMGLCERVTIFGHISGDVLNVLYSYCDIFCMPSRIDDTGVGEGLPVALMEAMSYEKAVVATTHTGIPELVPDILVPENDAAALAEAIGRLADDRELRRVMGERNRKIVSEQYSRANVESLLNALKQDSCLTAHV